MLPNKALQSTPKNGAAELYVRPAENCVSTQGDRLERWKQVAQIASAVAVPVVLAILGYFVQRSLADAGLKKDYVQMALSVLKEGPSSFSVDCNIHNHLR